MVDECVNISNREQLVLCSRYVDTEVVAHEDFIGLYKCPNITANTIVAAIDDVLLRLNLSIPKYLSDADTIKNIPLLSSVMDSTFEISELLQHSPQQLHLEM